jgi:vitamin B12 transporter
MPNLRLGASYTYLTDPSGVEEIRRPPHSGRADVTYLFDWARGTLNVAAIYNGNMTDTNFGSFPATTVTLGEYLLLNASVSYRLQPNLEIYGRVENALNENYQEISGFNTPGIAAYTGVRITLDDPTTASWAKYR